jgi:hypothetical protein
MFLYVYVMISLYSEILNCDWGYSSVFFSLEIQGRMVWNMIIFMSQDENKEKFFFICLGWIKRKEFPQDTS